MNITETLHLIVGIMLLITAALITYVSANWIWFIVFIGANLIQSSFTKWCLLSIILKKLGVKP